MSHSAFGKNVGLGEVMQKFSGVTDFLKFLFPRNWKDLGHEVHSPESERLLPTVRFLKLLITGNLSY